MAEQAQQKLDEVQKNFNEGQGSGQQQGGPAVEYDKHGRPVNAPASADAPAGARRRAAPPIRRPSPPPRRPACRRPPAEPPARRRRRTRPSPGRPLEPASRRKAQGDPLLRRAERQQTPPTPGSAPGHDERRPARLARPLGQARYCPGSMALGTILTAIVTPFDADGRFDEEAFVALHRHVVRARLRRRRGLRHDGRGVDARRRGAPARRRAGGRRRSRTGRPSSPARARTTPRHAVEMTERATALGVDADPRRSRRTTTSPRAAGSSRTTEAVAAATDKPIVLYNIPAAHGARHAERPARRARADRRHRGGQAGQPRQPRAGRRARHLRGQRRHARRRRSTSARPGGILTASHLVGDRMRRMVDASPRSGGAIEDELRPLFDALSAPPSRDRRSRRRSSCSASAPAGRACRYVPLDDARARRVCARRSSATGCWKPHGLERPPAHPPPRRARGDRQEHDRPRVRGPHRRRRHRPALPDGRDAGRRPRPARLLLPARPLRGHRGDRHHPRARGPRRRAAVGAARDGRPAAGLRRPADDGHGPLAPGRAPAARHRARGRRRRRDHRGRARSRSRRST